MQNFKRLEGLQEVTPKERALYHGKILPCKMVCVKKFLTPQQMKELNTTKTRKAKSRMVMCGNFAIDTERLCESTSSQHVTQDDPESHQWQ
eukprot:12318282-Prorocentrum_lima.AAC.1